MIFRRRTSRSEPSIVFLLAAFAAIEIVGWVLGVELPVLEEERWGS